MTVLPIGGESPAPKPHPFRRELLRLANSFEAAAERTRQASDPDAIHDLRVAIRRLSAALSLWRDGLRDGPRRKAVRRLRRLRRSLGPARELEVHIADLESRAGVQSFALRLLLGELIPELRRKLERTRREAATRVRAKRVRRIVRAVKRAVRRGGQPDLESAPHDRVAAVANRAREAMTLAATLGDDGSLHAARVATKKWRYSIEAALAAREDAELPAPTPAGDPPPVSAELLRSVQRALGDVQDRATLRDRLVGHATELRERGLGPQATSLGPLVSELESERRKAVATFLRLSTSLTDPQARPARIEPENL